ILQLDFSAKPFITDTPDGNVRLATQVPLLHVSLRRADPLQRTPHMVDVVVSFPRRTKVRLRYDLSEGHTGAVEIDVGIKIDIRKSFMHVLACVFLEVQTRNPDLLRTPLERMSGLVALGSHDLELAVSRERLIVLRDLVTLGQVGIEVVFAGEDRL